jgi:hypothetical protein
MLVSYKGIFSLITLRDSLWGLQFSALILAFVGVIINWLFLFNKLERAMFTEKIVGMLSKKRVV